MTDEPLQEEEQVEEQQPEPEDDRLLRLAADFENYKKRAARERSEYIARRASVRSTSSSRTSG